MHKKLRSLKNDPDLSVKSVDIIFFVFLNVFNVSSLNVSGYKLENLSKFVVTLSK